MQKDRTYKYKYKQKYNDKYKEKRKYKYTYKYIHKYRAMSIRRDGLGRVQINAIKYVQTLMADKQTKKMNMILCFISSRLFSPSTTTGPGLMG